MIAALFLSLVLAPTTLALNWRCRWWVRVVAFLALFPGLPGVLVVWVLVVGDH